MIFFDEDVDARFYRVEAGTMTEDKLYPIVDHLAGTQTQILSVGINAQKTNFPSRVMQSFTDGFDIRLGLEQPWMMESRDNWLFRRSANLSVLEAHGIDSNRVLIDRARNKGLSPWISVRMNDSHGMWLEKSPMMCDLWYRRPDLRIQKMYPQCTFDYAKSEVRDMYVSLIEECLNRYQPDGLLVEWMRHPPFFNEGEGEDHIGCLTEVMERVRVLVDRLAGQLGRKLEIAASVPASVRFARNYGIDAVDWANRKLVDRLILAPKLLLDTSIDPRAWRPYLKNPDFPLTVRIENIWQCYPDGPYGTGILDELKALPRNHVAFDRGAAWVALHRGSDGVALFNHMGARNDPEQSDIFTQCGELQSLQGKSRWFMLAYADLDMDDWTFFKGWREEGYFTAWREEQLTKGTYPYALPCILAPGEVRTLFFNSGPVVENNAKVSLRFTGLPSSAAVSIAGVPCQHQGKDTWIPQGRIRGEQDLSVTVENTSTNEKIRIEEGVLKIDF